MLSRRDFVGAALAAPTAILALQEKKPMIPPGLDTPNPFVKPIFRPGTKVELTEVWFYGADEESKHGFKTHFGSDCAVAPFTPVIAPADGFALASFHLSFAGIKDGTASSAIAGARTIDGKFVEFGLGYFVQIWCPEQRLYIALGHLSEINRENVPFIQPVAQRDGWNPTVLYQAPEEVIKVCKPIKAGQEIGKSGRSGCALGKLERPGMHLDPTVEADFWDEPHVHVEIYDRSPATGFSKWHRYDPCGVYGHLKDYDLKNLPKTSLWLTGPV